VRNLSIKLYRIYACYTNITLYDIYSVWYNPRFSVTAGLGTYCPRIQQSTVLLKFEETQWWRERL